MAPIEFQVTREDALAAARLHHRGYIGSRFCLVVVACGAGLGASFIYAVIQPAPGAIGWAALGAAQIVVGLYAILLIRHAIYPVLVVRRRFREQKNVRHTYLLSWSDRSYVFQGPTGHLDLPWGEFWRWREDGRVLLFCHSSKLYQIVPKRLLAPNVTTDLRGYLLRASVPRWRMLFG